MRLKEANIMDCILPEYRLSEEQFDELWKNCIFVLDTSVIFNIYRYSPGLRKEVDDVLRKISDRLWIPYQVAYEYYDNVSSVISDEINKYNQIISFISSIEKPKKGEIDKGLRRKHTSSSEILVDLEKEIADFELEFDKKLKIIGNGIKEKIKNYPKRENLEEINEIIISLFDDKVGKPYSIKELEQISEEGAKRYNLLLPPGYEDEKDKRGIKIYGDLIVWLQIIDMAKQKKVPVIFICDDLKEDWWWSPSDTTLGPRPELVQEFVSETKELFWMYSLDRFMKYAQKYINIEVKEKMIEDAKEYRIDEEKMIKETEFLNNFIKEVSLASGALGNIDPKVLESFRHAAYIDPKVLESFRHAAYIDPKVLESFRQATYIDPKVLESFRQTIGQLLKARKESSATTEI